MTLIAMNDSRKRERTERLERLLRYGAERAAATGAKPGDANQIVHRMRLADEIEAALIALDADLYMELDDDGGFYERTNRRDAAEVLAARIFAARDERRAADEEMADHDAARHESTHRPDGSAKSLDEFVDEANQDGERWQREIDEYRRNA